MILHGWRTIHVCWPLHWARQARWGSLLKRSVSLWWWNLYEFSQCSSFQVSLVAECLYWYWYSICGTCENWPWVHGNSIMYPRMATLPDHSIQRSGAQFNQQDTDPLILELSELSKLVASILLISILLKPTAGCWKKNIRRRRACSATSSTSISAPWAKLGPVAATCGSYVWKIYFGIMIRTYRHTEHTRILMVFRLFHNHIHVEGTWDTISWLGWPFVGHFGSSGSQFCADHKRDSIWNPWSLPRSRSGSQNRSHPPNGLGFLFSWPIHFLVANGWFSRFHTQWVSRFSRFSRFHVFTVFTVFTFGWDGWVGWVGCVFFFSAAKSYDWICYETQKWQACL